ncbi:MAG: AsnC family transcriptional regulator, partial [Candidatus Bathyarchaeia archaeon]|nr:AsnC family transcriptional regulator [Candidatus Bathyarchaeia archaeon]
RGLRKAGIITGAITQINPRFFGYNCIAFIAIEAESNSEEVHSFLKEIPGTVLIIQYTGRYNFLSFLASKNIDELATTIERIKEHPQINEAVANLWIDITRLDYPENLIITPSDKKPSKTTSLLGKEREPKTVDLNSIELQAEKNGELPSRLDETDIKIIRLISENARMAFSEIGKRVGISTQSVSKRYYKMRQDVLPFSSITLNLGKLGYEAAAAFLVKTEKQKKENILHELTHIPNIIVALKTLGAIDIWLLAPVASFEELFKLEKSIYAVKGVTKIEVLLRTAFANYPRSLFNKLI